MSRSSHMERLLAKVVRWCTMRRRQDVLLATPSPVVPCAASPCSTRIVNRAPGWLQNAGMSIMTLYPVDTNSASVASTRLQQRSGVWGQYRMSPS
ncbi:hypothetical protein CGRA01v4_03254 [Colletotrichum graminicola]|nr:hypothetical protein CGRA01v4_03254 [Colletotrichum graminicola]